MHAWPVLSSAGWRLRTETAGPIRQLTQGKEVRRFLPRIHPRVSTAHIVMNILVVGGGGREHAIIKKLRNDPRVDRIYALPGNGGIAAAATCVDIAATDIEGIVEFAKGKDIGLAVVTPDNPLVAGCVDALQEIGIKCFGPTKKAALIEGSKIFSKELMKHHNIPTAAFETFDDMNKALEYVETAPMPIVIKADGLALGKGVMICDTVEDAKIAIRSMMEERVFGDSGSRIVIEEVLTGPEVSVLTFTDGKVIFPLVTSMDHKRAHYGDRGRNTGGMGAIAPNPFYSPQMAERCMAEIFRPTIRAMREDGRPFRGCLYFGLMLTEDGPKVIEYNCRFGDPEAQVVLPLLRSNLLDTLLAVANGRLSSISVSSYHRHACCVVMASDGYPEDYATGFEITLPDVLDEDEEIYIAGARREGDTLITNGGRVLNAVGIGDTLEQAIEKAYGLVDRIHFANSYVRKDIGLRALEAQTKEA